MSNLRFILRIIFFTPIFVITMPLVIFIEWLMYGDNLMVKELFNEIYKK